MDSATGRWVSGNDFFDRKSELGILEARVLAGNHILLTGQRRMGKTSIARELGQRLNAKGWRFFFADVEGATCPEDVIAELARAVQPIRPVSSGVAAIARWFKGNVEEVGAHDLRIRIRAELTVGSWRSYGGRLFRDCAAHEQPILLVIDELPIFLKRILDEDDGVGRVDEFLSWLREEVQGLTARSLVLIISGSIGLKPLVERLGITDRVNHLDPVRIGPWDRETSIACFECLAASHGLMVEDGVPGAVYDKLGIGIPHHVQSFFAKLRDFSIMHSRDRVSLADVDSVYRTALLGPSGQNDLAHYESRLREALDCDRYTLAMEILAEAATQGCFSAGARRGLEEWYADVVDDPRRDIQDVLAVLEHDGYLEEHEGGFRFPSRLLMDWWVARFRDHHSPIEGRRTSS